MAGPDLSEPSVAADPGEQLLKEGDLCWCSLLDAAGELWLPIEILLLFGSPADVPFELPKLLECELGECMLESLAFEAVSSRSLPPLSSFFSVSAASIDFRCIPEAKGPELIRGCIQLHEIGLRYGRTVQHLLYVKLCVAPVCLIKFQRRRRWAIFNLWILPNDIIVRSLFGYQYTGEVDVASSDTVQIAGVL